MISDGRVRLWLQMSPAAAGFHDGLIDNGIWSVGVCFITQGDVLTMELPDGVFMDSK